MRFYAIGVLGAALLLGCQVQGGTAVSGAASPAPGGASSQPAAPSPALTGLAFLDDMALGVTERGIQGAVFYRVGGRGVSETGAKPFDQMTLGDETWTAWFYNPQDRKSYRATPGSGVRAILVEETDAAKQYKDGYRLDRQAIAIDSPRAAQIVMKPAAGGDVTLLSPQEYLEKRASQEKNGRSAAHPLWGIPATLNTGATGTVYVDAATGVVLE